MEAIRFRARYLVTLCEGMKCGRWPPAIAIPFLRRTLCRSAEDAGWPRLHGDVALPPGPDAHRAFLAAASWLELQSYARTLAEHCSRLLAEEMLEKQGLEVCHE